MVYHADTIDHSNFIMCATAIFIDRGPTAQDIKRSYTLFTFRYICYSLYTVMHVGFNLFVLVNVDHINNRKMPDMIYHDF